MTVKHDTGKPMMGLIELEQLEGLARVLEFGAEKYEPDGWKTVSNAQERYFSALIRHLAKWQSGEQLDSESGLRHLDHALANLYFLCYEGDK